MFRNIPINRIFLVVKPSFLPYLSQYRLQKLDRNRVTTTKSLFQPFLHELGRCYWAKPRISITQRHSNRYCFYSLPPLVTLSMTRNYPSLCVNYNVCLLLCRCSMCKTLFSPWKAYLSMLGHVFVQTRSFQFG